MVYPFVSSREIFLKGSNVPEQVPQLLKTLNPPRSFISEPSLFFLWDRKGEEEDPVFYFSGKIINPACQRKRYGSRGCLLPAGGKEENDDNTKD